MQAVSLTAESLTNDILDTLCTFDLDPEWIVSQGYDGASVMSGGIALFRCTTTH